MNTSTLTILLSLVISANGCSSGQHRDENEATIYSWEVIARSNIDSFLLLLNKHNNDRSSLINIYGLPEMSKKTGFLIKDSWVFGRRRHSVLNKGKSSSVTTYQVSYAIVKTVWRSDKLIDCTVTTEEFIGSDKKPDPFNNDPIQSENQSCRAFQKD